MDDIDCLTQGDQAQQHCLTEIVLHALKSMYPSIPREMKDSISLKKAAAGDRDWSVTKEILGWIINTSTGTLSLFPKHITNLNQLLDPPTQRRMSHKKLERLIGTLRSIHLAIPRGISHFYHIQMPLTKANHWMAYLSAVFYQDVAHCQLICA